MSDKQYVGIDLHRRRSVIVVVDQQGKHLSTVRVEDPLRHLITLGRTLGVFGQVILRRRGQAQGLGFTACRRLGRELGTQQSARWDPSPPDRRTAGRRRTVSGRRRG